MVDDRFEQLNAGVAGLMEQHSVPGLAVGMIIDGEESIDVFRGSGFVADSPQECHAAFDCPSFISSSHKPSDQSLKGDVLAQPVMWGARLAGNREYALLINGHLRLSCGRGVPAGASPRREHEHHVPSG